MTNISNENDWNQSWIFQNWKSLPTNATECKKVWLLGPSGCGKTTLLEFMGIRQAQADNIETTEGEEFLTDSNWPNTIFVDTQGLYQLEGKYEADIKEQIIFDHAHRCADVIILVIPKLQRHNATMFFEMVERIRSSHRYSKSLLFIYISGSFRALYVVHSLPQFEDNSDILEYRRIVNDYLSENENVYCRIDKEESNIMVSWHGSGMETVCVNHFFVGNKVCSWSWYWN